MDKNSWENWNSSLKLFEFFAHFWNRKKSMKHEKLELSLQPSNNFRSPQNPKFFLWDYCSWAEELKNERSKGSVDEGLAITHAIFRRGSQYHTKFGVPKIEVTRYVPRVLPTCEAWHCGLKLSGSRSRSSQFSSLP